MAIIGSDISTLAKKFAQEYGTFLGILWSADFLLYVFGMRELNGILLFLCMLGFISLPLWAFYFAWRFRVKVIPDTPTFRNGMLFGIMMFIYSCLFTGAVEFVYFKYLDNGATIEAIEKLVNSTAILETYRQAGMGDMVTTIKASLDELSGLSAFDLTLALFNQNVMTTFILLLPTAFIATVKIKVYNDPKL